MKIVINNTNKLLNSSTLSTFKPKNLVQTVKNFGNKGLKYASIAATSLGLATLAISKPSNIRLIDSIPDGAELDYDSTKKLFEACRNSDFTCKYELLNDTLKKVACTKGKDESTQIIIDLINSFGDLNDITKKYPEFSEFFMGSICHDSFKNNEIIEEIQYFLDDGYISEDILPKYEDFFKNNYILDGEYCFNEMNKKVIVLDGLKGNDEERFDKLSFDTRQKLIDTNYEFFEKKVVDDAEVLEKIVSILPEEKINYYCDNTSKIPELMKDIVDSLLHIIPRQFSKLENKYKEKDNDKKNDCINNILLKMSFMNILYPENYRTLIKTTIFDEIKKGNINFLALEKIDISQKPDDKYLKTIVLDFENEINEKINNIPNIDSLGAVKFCLKNLNLDKIDLEKIEDTVSNAKDKQFIYEILSKIPLLTNNKDRDKDKLFIIELLNSAKDNPEQIKRLINIDGYNRSIIISGKKMFERVGDNLVIEKLLKRNIDKNLYRKIFSNLTENNVVAIENYLDITPEIDLKHIIKLLVLRNFSDLKDATKCEKIVGQLSEFSKDLDKDFCPEKFDEYGQNLFRLSSLVDLKLFAPKKFNEIKDSGYFDLCKNNDFGIEYLRLLSSKSNLNENIYNDLEKLKNNEEIIPSYSKGTSLETVFAQSKCGDVVEIGEKLYINDGSRMIKWQMTKQKYLELFPPVKRFINLQNGVGNCYFISSISSLMNNPKTRVNLYKSFKQEGNDVLVTIKSYEDYKGTVRIENSELPYKDKNTFLIGSKGMQMLEYAYAKTTLRECNDEASVREGAISDNVVERISGGKIYVPMSEILGLEMELPTSNLPVNLDGLSIDYVPNDCTSENIEDFLEKYANNSDYLLQFGTDSIDKKEQPRLSLKYNICENHAHYIVGYDSLSKIVKISNPHNSGVVTDVPLKQFARYLLTLNITKIN